ncbi:AAA family ATPase [Bradyrhizobium sp. Pha-3]|uniref:AAA family ATPase n=1 Tax=Bradyrhizobium sp. Pha-3 TaxID=208375 RepID=UPI0035D3F256
MTLSPRAAEWFEARAIDPEIVARMGIFSGKRVTIGDENSVVPDVAGDILVFPYFENGVDVAAKYRARPRPDGSKVMWQRPNGRRTFYNADVLDDPKLSEGSAALVVVEGEPDCLAVQSAGYPFVVSVPDGAPPDRDAQGRELPTVPSGTDDIDPDNDDKFKFLANNWDRLKKIKRFVLMTDDDGPGRRLREELARRLGHVRCSFVQYPNCLAKKPDANEVLLQHGASAIVTMIANAMPYPIKGVYRMSDFPEPPPMNPVSTGWGRLDLPVQEGMAGLMLERGLFMTVLGIPGSGKSTWTTQLATNVARNHGWRVGVATFEMKVKPYMQKLIRTAFLGRAITHFLDPAVREADRFINEQFVFFHCELDDDEEDPTVDWLLDRAADAVVRYGLDMLVVDPWNELEHQRRRDESLTEYVGRAVKKLKRFARVYNVLVIVVIHPTKEGGLKGIGSLSLYDAADSSHWVNKADYGVKIEGDHVNGQTIVDVGKIRHRVTGRRGRTIFNYIPELELISQ